MSLFRRLLPAFAVGAVLSLAGCVGGVQGAEPSATGSGAGTPTSTPTAATWTIAFAGDCDRMLAPAQREAVLGAPTVDRSVLLAAMRQESERVEFPEAIPGAEATAGGLACTWVEGDGASWGPRQWSALVLPAAGADPGTVAALADPVCAWSYDTRICRLGVSVDGLWILAAVSPMETDEEPPTATLQALIAAVAQNAATGPTPVPAPATPQRWTIATCADLGERMGLAELIGEGYWTGYWEGPRQPEEDILEHAGVRQRCQFGTGDAAYESGEASIGSAHHLVTVTSQPGGAWMWTAEDVSTGEAVAVPGTQAAQRIVPSRPELVEDTVRATDGTNLIQVHVTGGLIAPELTARAVAALARG